MISLAGGCNYCVPAFAQCLCRGGAPLPRLHGFHHMFRMRLTTSGVMRGSIALRSMKLRFYEAQPLVPHTAKCFYCWNSDFHTQ